LCLRSKYILLAAILTALSGAAFAQGGVLGGDLSVPPTPVPVGSGARAAGMGNAFVAIADDATAASWNPAGLVQLERPELSIVGAYTFTAEDFRAWHDPMFDGWQEFNQPELNYLSAALPLPFLILGRNAVVSLNYQRRYDFTRNFDVDFRDRALLAPPIGLLVRQTSKMSFDQEGALSAISPAFAIELTNTLSIGATLNLWRSTFLNDNRWEQTTRIDSRTFVGGSLSLSRGYSKETYEDFRGENLTLGLLWNVRPRWNIGLRYDSAFTGEADYESFDREFRIGLANPIAPLVNFDANREQRKIRFPDTWAAGVAWRKNDRLTLSLDVSRTDWNDLYVKDARGRKFSLVDGALLQNPLQRVHFDPTWNVRFGGEYVFVPRTPKVRLPYLWSLRGGLSYEEEPASNRNTRDPFVQGNGEPDRFYGVSLGVGVQAWQRVNFDFAYQFRYGPDVNADVFQGVEGFESDEFRHRLLFSTVIYF
jgi:long-subunit fatty acid transport protein